MKIVDKRTKKDKKTNQETIEDWHKVNAKLVIE